MALIFDSHSHYDSSQFDEDRFELLNSMQSRGVGLILSASSNVESTFKNCEIAKKFPFVFTSGGVHPIDCQYEKEPYLDTLKKLFSENPKMVAVGEIGLDYHYDTPIPLQKRFFEEQLQLAKELNKPVILHCREATADMMEILREYKPKGVVHCFSGSVETAREVLDLGLYIGFTGVLTFKNAEKPRKSASYVPLDRLLIETDAPYMAPVPFRGERCDSSMLHSVAEKLSELKGVSKEEILEVTFNNAVKAFEMEALI